MADIVLYHPTGVSKNVPQTDVSYWESQGWTRTSPGGSSAPPAPPSVVSPPSNPSGTKEIVKAGDKLYAFDGAEYSYIPNQQTLENLVFRQGYQDTRREISVPGSQAGGNVENKEDYSVVKFDNSPAVYLVDHNTHNLQPFLNEMAFENAFQDRADEAWNSIETVTEDDLNQGGRLAGYQVLGTENGIREDGSVPEPDGPSPAAISERYGRDNNEDTNWTAYLAVDGFLDLLRITPNSGVTPATIDAIKNDPSKTSMLMNAVAYGGYTLEDIYKEVKRQDLVRNGDKSFEGVSAISASKMKDDFVSGEGSSILSNPRLSMPGSLSSGVSNPDLYRLKLYQMPPELFKELVPTLDISSEAFQQEANQIKDVYHDILMQNFEAQTEQEKAIADENYRLFKEQVEKKYGVALSDNAVNAWDQIENLFTSIGERGLTNSGIGREEVANYLKKVRSQDARLREANLTEKETEERDFYLKSASSREIQDLVSSDPEKAKRWGIIPSEETKQKLSVENLMKEYGIDEKKAKDYQSWILDENGNYRSNLYQALKSNIVQTESEKKQFQVETLLGKNLQKEEQAYAQVSTPDNPYSNYTPPNSDLPSVLEQANKNSSQKTPAVVLPSLTEEQKKDTTYKYVPSAPVGWTTNPDTGKLMKIPENYSLDREKGIYKQALTPSSSSSSSTSDSGKSETTQIKPFTPPSGYEYIPNVESMKNFSDIIKDTTPGSKKLYGKKVK